MSATYAVAPDGEFATLTVAFLGDYLQFFLDNQAQLWELLMEHLAIVGRAMLIAVPLGVLLGTVITYDDRLATVVLWLAGVMMTVPSIALFGLLIPYLGIGKPPVVFALILYTQLPVVRNTYVGLSRVDEAAVEAGTGLGMTRVQRLRRVQVPMALPVIMAGVRNAVVLLIGIAAIGAFVGAGGLGDLIFDGIDSANTAKIVVTTAVLSGFTLAVDYVLASIEQVLRLRNGEEVEPKLGTRVLSGVLGRVSATGGASRPGASTTTEDSVQS
ncbi:ABC transporter permease [Haloarchaeobius sp. HME9146]|uniref:ABC transporter permease n=1 Tax=Haloarchaeobius sp. HME9146 TaxID=2978732 RepID=UPI0021C18732|nr:ABC transporter permease [Haloarchaeobius sp. HME9146]MCT9095580.1 ABC transporter permease [Haloarchaeobius sp. HME9146]